MAIDNFSQIKDKGLKLKDYVGEQLYDKTALGHIVKIIPIKDNKSLVISWPQLPDVRHLWNGRPGSYLSHVIGHEGKYSLKSELIK